MGTELQVAVISGVFAVLATLLSIRNEVRSKRVAADVEGIRLAESRRLEREKSIAPFKEPLARAAYDLQSRIYNIVKQGLVYVYYTRGDDRQRSYVVDNTTFLVAQYFAWTEIIRQHAQYLDLGEDETTRRLAHLQDDIHTMFSTDGWPRPFRVFAGEQRAIGEKMIRPAARNSECVGYAGFIEADFGKISPLLDGLREDVRSLENDLEAATPRLVAIQNALIDLLAYLDPQFVRFPKSRRSKLVAA